MEISKDYLKLVRFHVHVKNISFKLRTCSEVADCADAGKLCRKKIYLCTPVKDFNRLLCASGI